MGDLIDAVGVDLTGLSQPPARYLSVAENAEILALAVGGGRAAARLLGVGESTFRGWRKGATPRGGGDALVSAARAATGARYRPGHYADAYAGHDELVIRGVIRVSQDIRIRTVHPGRVIPKAKMQSVLRAWASGDDSRAERLLIKHIDEFYQPLDFDEILWARYE